MAEIKFGIFADLHVDIMHDSQQRLEAFLSACHREKVDFIIQLGDFCYPDSRKCICKPEHRPINIENAMSTPTYADKDAIIRLYREFERPAYHTIGNHDCDFCSKEEVLRYYGVAEKPYYSFDRGGFHFVVLDANYYRIGDDFYSYDHGNYFDCPFEGGTLPWIPPFELEWLENDLAQASYPAVLFSHQRLCAGRSSIRNAAEVGRILENAPQKVLMAMNGHEHLDEAEQVNGIWYWNVNSISNYWVDTKYMQLGRFGAEIDEKYPNLRYVIPYRDPVYSFVTLTDQGAMIKGIQSIELAPTSKDMGLGRGKPFYSDTLREDITASSQNRYLPF